MIIRPAAAHTTLFATCLLTAALNAASVGAATLLVDVLTDSVPPVGTCTSTGTGSCSLRQAVSSATPGDEIVFDATLGSPTSQIQLIEELVIDRDLTISGPGRAQLALVGSNDRVLHMTAASSIAVTLRDLTVRGGFAGTAAGTQYGGGLFVDLPAGQVQLEKVDFLGNTVSHPNGGGANLAVVATSLALQVSADDCNFISGIAQGGAVGGGIYVAGALLQVDGASFYGNEVAAGGGGAFAARSNALVYLTNSTVTQNFANEPGGALLADGGFIAVDFSSFVFNDSVGGINNAKEFYVSPMGGSISFGHTLINASRGMVCAADSTVNGGIQSSGFNLSNEPCFLDHPNDLAIQATGLRLSPEVDGTSNWYRLLDGSAAIDGGFESPTGICPTMLNSISTDQRGYSRPLDGDADGAAACDIGAAEVQLLFADGFESGNTSTWSTTVL